MTTLDDRPTAQADTDRLWWESAACRGIDRDLFFPISRSFAIVAIAHCQQCPVVAECRTDAINQRRASGVWGGQLWTDGRPTDPRPPRPGEKPRPLRPRPSQDADTAKHGARIVFPEATRRSVLLTFHQVRHLYSSNTSAARAVGGRYGVATKTIMNWLRETRATEAR